MMKKLLPYCWWSYLRKPTVQLIPINTYRTSIQSKNKVLDGKTRMELETVQIPSGLEGAGPLLQ
jgi:hypothetical protein